MAVYFFYNEDTNLVKIGLSKNPERLLKRVGEVERATESWYSIKIIGVKDGDIREEKELHEMFAKHRVHGEWFKPHRDIIVYIFDVAAPFDIWKKTFRERESKHFEQDYRNKIDISQHVFQPALFQDLNRRLHALADTLGINHNLLGQHILTIFLDEVVERSKDWSKDDADEYNIKAIKMFLDYGILESRKCYRCSRRSIAVVHSRSYGYCEDCELPDKLCWYQRYFVTPSGAIEPYQRNPVSISKVDDE